MNMIIPEKFTTVNQEKSLLFNYIKSSSNASKAPEILVPVTIASDLKVHGYTHFAEISQLLNLDYSCKSMIMEPTTNTIVE